MSKTKLTIFDPIREYLIAAIQKCPNPIIGIDTCPGAETLKCFYEYENYLNYDGSKKYQTIPAEFTKRVLSFAFELNKLDRSATRGTLEADLLTKIASYAVEYDGANFTGGASKIINLESTEQIGGAPFKSTKLVGSYSDEYLKGLTSEIKKTYNLFGGFKKTSKEIIGTIEELNVLLHNDIKQQLSNSLNQRYYKNYLTGGASKDVANLLKELSTGSVDQNDLDIFNEFMMVMELKKTDEVKATSGVSGKLASIEDPASAWRAMPPVTNPFSVNKNTWYRINLKRIGGPADLTDKGMKTDSKFVIENYIPISSGRVEDPAGGSQNSDWLRETFKCYLHKSTNGVLLDKGAKAGKIDDKCVEFDAKYLLWTDSLQEYLDCDKIIRDSLKSSKVNEAIEKDYPYKITYPNLDGWLRMDDGSYVKTLPNGDTVVYKEGDDKYNELFKTKNRCFNSYAYPGKNEDCCNWMKAVLAGHTDELPKFLKKSNFNWSSSPDDIKQAHPILVYKVLQAFGFNKDLIYDQATRGQKIWKMQSVAKWQTKFVDQKIKKDLVDIVKANNDLMVYLQVLVDYVNSNPSILNDGYVGSTNSTVIDVPEVFKKRGVLPCVNPNKKNKYSTNWNDLTKQINDVYGDFYKGLNFKSPSQFAFGFNNYFPLTQTYGYGNVYRGSTLRGGATSDGKSEVILDLKQSHPQFTTQVSVEIRKVLDKLKSLNKPLSDNEFNRIKTKLKQFSDLEIELYNHIGAIDTYSKLVSIFNKEGSRETVNMNFIRNYINRYQPLVDKFENTKTGLEGFLSVIKEYADEEEENDVDFSVLARRGL